MSHHRNLCKVRCRGIIIHDGKLLVVNHGHTPSFYALPGGHLDHGEDPITCIRREIFEELGIEPTIGRLLFVHNHVSANSDQSVEFFFDIVNSADFMSHAEKEKSHGYEIIETRWVSPEDDVRILPETFWEIFQKGSVYGGEIRFI